MSNKIDNQVEEFFLSWPTRVFKKGEILIWAGYSPEHIYYIRRGQVGQFSILSEGKKVTLNVYKSKAFFPMSWAINRSVNHFYYEATEDVEVFCAPADQALQFILDNPEVLLDLTSRLYKGMDGILQKMTYSLLKETYKIVIFELIIEYKRTAKRTANYSGFVALNEEELASQVGLTRETVNRQLARLKPQGLISIKSGGIFVHDIVGLEDLLR